jgi:peptidase inhibitor family I36
MTASSRRRSFAVALLVLASMSLAAQARWGRGQFPKSGACFYEDAGFRGEYFCLRPGDDVRALTESVNDRISSIRIFGDIDVVVFRDYRFRGDSARFSSDVRNLDREGWNDTISSLKVEGSKWGSDRHRPPVWGRPSLPREGACFYRDADFRGEYFCAPRGATYAELPPGFNDRISSIRLIGARLTIFEDVDFNGRSERIDSDVTDLGRRWNDRISSFRVF